MTRRLGSGSSVIATHNAGKLKEIGALLEPYGVKRLSAGSLGLPEPAETGTTFAQNALIKARAAAEASGLAALADDSGLSVAALDGRPGVDTADLGRAAVVRGRARPRLVHGDGQGRRDAGRKGRGCRPLRRVPLRLALAWPDGEYAIYEGRCEGR